MNSLEGKTAAVGVTGGIAAYKAAALMSAIRQRGATVVPVMTASAREFITPLTLETVAGSRAMTDMFERPAVWEVAHIALARRIDALIIAPCTANVIGKLAHGIADDFLTTMAVATKAPILLAPAMNTGMWASPAVQENLRILRGRGVHTVGPESGFLAEGTDGAGRMSEPAEILEAVFSLLTPHDLLGRRVLVTAGPTVEDIDPVRCIANRSSGRMGYAVARAAVRRGAAVTLITGPVALDAPRGVEAVPVRSTEDLYRAMMERCLDQDIVIQAAAPADYRPEAPAERKIKSGQELALKLIPNPDVASAVGARKRPGQIIVAFAAETEALAERAAAKLAKKNADIVVANDVTQEGAGFEVDTNIATLVTSRSREALPLMGKDELADIILDRAVALLG